MDLVIVESPGKVKKIQGFLGSKFKVMASVGHVRDLPLDEMGVESPNFIPHYVPTARGKEILARLAAAVKEAERVYLGLDLDREGESIAWHLADALQLKTAQRITYTEVTEQALKAAVKAPRPINSALVAAQECRRVLDRLFGYTVSPVVSNFLGSTLSAGRVQSPAVRLVVDREQEIRNFSSTTHYGVELHFPGNGGENTWKAVWLPNEGWLEPDAEYLLDKKIAERVALIRGVTVLECKDTESKTAPPPPFITSTLQQAASSSLKMNPKKTMATAQKLYEAGLITYMRTDAPFLSEEAEMAIRSWATEHGFAVPEKPRKWKSKAGAQEAHEAIRPTHIEQEHGGETEDEQALYRLIRLRVIASQLEDARYAVRTARLEGKAGGKSAIFEAKGKKMVVPGWKALVAIDQTEESEIAEADNPVPGLTSEEQLTAVGSKMLTKKTKPPARYSEAALIKELERRGIGRPSTYAAILENVLHRQYLRIEKRMLAPTDLGEKVIDALVRRFSFLEYTYTQQMETALDLIAKGKAGYRDVVKEAYDKLEADVARFVQEGQGKGFYTCSICGKPLRHHQKKDTAKKKGYNFWACVGYPDCKATYTDNNGNPGELEEKKVPAESSGFECPKCGKPLIHRHGKKHDKGEYSFFGCSGYPKCTATYSNNNGKPGELHEKKKVEFSKFKCKKCGNPLVHRAGKSDKGEYSFYGCSGYPKCKITYPEVDGKPSYDQDKVKL